MTTNELFFFENAGFSYDPRTETALQGKMKCAAELAKAEAWANAHGLEALWQGDADAERPGDEECLLFHGDICIASLHGIEGATDAYRRVVEAELALGAMGDGRVADEAYLESIRERWEENN